MRREDDDFTFCQMSTVDDFTEASSMLDINRVTLKDGDSGLGYIEGSNNLERNEHASKDGLSKKKRVVGSLTFSVIDSSYQDKPSISSTTKDVKSYSRVPKESNTGIVEYKPRAKVPYEIGYSQMDWIKLTRGNHDLAALCKFTDDPIRVPWCSTQVYSCLRGESNKRMISMGEVKAHQSEGSMWTVLKGRVYNLYAYMKFHPGGVDMLMKAVGKDCTSIFNKYHAWVNSEFLLEKCLVGTFDDAPFKNGDTPPDSIP